MNLLRRAALNSLLLLPFLTTLHTNALNANGQISWQNSDWYKMFKTDQLNPDAVHHWSDLVPRSVNHETRHKRVHGTWKWTITNFDAPSGNFEFRILITSPSGKIYRSKKLNAADLPTPPLSIKLKNPEVGPHLIFFHLLKITTIGSVGILATTSNTKNTRKFLSFVGVSGDPLLLHKRVIASAISIP